jgi:hypothetical protein
MKRREFVTLLGSATAWSLSFCTPSLLRGGRYDTNADRAVYAANNDRPFVGSSSGHKTVSTLVEGARQLAGRRQ